MRIVVRVDQTVCMGNQLCLGEAPGIFELDDEGHAHLVRLTFTESDIPSLESAAALCPTEAINVELRRDEVA